MAGLIYDAAGLENVIKNFCVMTNVSLSVHDDEFETLASYSEQTPAFCIAVQNAPNGRERCVRSDTELLKRCRESGKIESHICHAGVMDAAMPIIKESKIIGYIIIGRTRVASFDEIEPRLDWLRADRETLKACYEKMQTYNDRQIHSMFELASMLVSFILTNELIRPEESALARAAQRYIAENLAKPLSVDSLCRTFGVSKNSLYANFHTAFGKTVNEYITDMRLKQAKKLLCETSLSIDRISEQTGFASYTYFSRLFKKKYGLSPLAYRKARE